MLHADLSALFSSKECRHQDNVANVAASEIELTREKVEIDVISDRRAGPESNFARCAPGIAPPERENRRCNESAG